MKVKLAVLYFAFMIIAAVMVEHGTQAGCTVNYTANSLDDSRDCGDICNNCYVASYASKVFTCKCCDYCGPMH